MPINIEKIKELPDNPGVYFFLGKQKEILYIGKATSLRDRVKSYFSKDLPKTRSQIIVNMIEKASSIDYRVTDSVLEALMLEADLIKKFQPPANTDEKDDKSFLCVIITNEDFPRVLTVRKKDLYTQYDERELKYVFGPYPHGMQLKEALKIVRRIFPYRDNKCIPAEDQIAKGKTPRPCFNRQIGLCPGVCTGEISKKDYGKQIQHLKLFFEGRKAALIKDLEKEMKGYAKEQEFEKAAKVRHTIYALNHIQDVSLIKREREEENENVFRIEAYDIAHMSGKDTTGVMVVVEDGEAKKSDYRKFKIMHGKGNNEIASLKEVLRRRLGHFEWPLPNLIVVDGGQAQINATQALLNERGFNIDIVSIVKDERHKPKDLIGEKHYIEKHSSEILLANSEAHRFVIAYHKKLRGKSFL